MEESNPQVLPSPAFQEQLPSIQRHLPCLKTESGGVEPLQHYAARWYSKPVAVHTAALSKTPREGLEPTTSRLTAVCSAIELSRNEVLFQISDCRFKKQYLDALVAKVKWKS